MTGPRGGSPPERTDPPSFALVHALDGVEDVALSDDVGCARDRSDVVRCWGQVLRDRGIVRRDLPVDVAGLDGAERLVAFGAFVCALQRGAVTCWGGDRPVLGGVGWRDRPQPIVSDGVVTGLALVGDSDDDNASLCVSVVGASVRCWFGTPFGPASTEITRGWSGGMHSLVGTARHLCALDAQSQAWCTYVRSDWSGSEFVRVPGFDGFERLVQGEDMFCALRGGALRCAESHIDLEMIDEPLAHVAWRYEHLDPRRALERTTPMRGALLQTFTPSKLERGERTDEGDMALREVLGSGVVASVAAGVVHHCILGTDGHVACRWTRDPNAAASLLVTFDVDEPAAVVPGLDDAVELAVTRGGLACARRASGRVACWGRNVGGALTAAWVVDSPRLYRLDELAARAFTH